MIHKWHLQRLTWLIQKRLQGADLNIPIDVIAEELADVAVIKIKAEVFGEVKSAVVELDVPGGPWQALKACFGLPYRKQRLYMTATQIFPELVVPKDQTTVVYMEADDAA